MLKVKVLVLRLRRAPLFVTPAGCSPPGSSVPGDSPGENTGVSCHSLLQGIFPTQGSNSGLLPFRQILYQPEPEHGHYVGSLKTRAKSLRTLGATSTIAQHNCKWQELQVKMKGKDRGGKNASCTSAERGEKQPEQDLRDGNTRLRAAAPSQACSRQPGLSRDHRSQAASA